MAETMLETPCLGAAQTSTWCWNGYDIRFSQTQPTSSSSKPAVVMIHGFGSSCDTWRNQYDALAEAGHPVYGIDLLGLGGSEKAADADYSITLWKNQIFDFIQQVVKSEDVILFGNSIGSLVSVNCAADAEKKDIISGLVLMNCAAGMNSKFVLYDKRTSPVGKAISAVVFGILEVVLNTKPIAQYFFNNLRGAGNIESVLQNVYVNKAAVDADLVQSICKPAEDPAALDVFVKIVIGDPGVTPDTIMDQVTAPMLLVWGDQDIVTPLKVGYGPYFTEELVETRPNTELVVVNGGHCPHDDCPADVNAGVLEWLARLPVLDSQPVQAAKLE
eukprot:CAMPEP_0196720642 /NCGR_PEP_ID=MMETSP1091-20130531/3397_1 /TAXON_ID=302021 /ORGANISM="Rhodomonas sp., Strain CCMP768" /LENGTH=330 /DNA_ID=CAMNT_0042061941 /DNA_START=224 /DNA_END=1216 /DNA_ORIENTATION=-